MFLMPGSRAKSLNPSHAVQYLRSQSLTATQQTTVRTTISAVTDTAVTSWTPTFTAATPGDLSISYALRNAQYYRVGKMVTASMQVQTSAFTWTTASGSVSITGLPFAANNNVTFQGVVGWGNFTHSGYTDLTLILGAGSTTMSLFAAGQPAIGGGNDVISSFPSGGTLQFNGTITYFTN